MIVITRDELIGLGACDPGLTWFDEHVPSGRAEFPGITALRVWAALRNGDQHVAWLLASGDKSHRGVDLRGARLAYSVLEGVRLEDADLSGADLSGVEFKRAYLKGAKLKNAKLTQAGLVDATLRRADLTDADLTQASIEGADLTQAFLRRAVLSEATLVCTCLDGADLTGADLERTDLEHATLAGAIRSSSDPPIHGWETYPDGEILRLRKTT